MKESILISINELAKELKVPKATIYQWVHRKKIPHFKAGRALRFDLNEVLHNFKKCQAKKNNKKFKLAESLKIEKPK
jgi:excisionase family DNA binding protein